MEATLEHALPKSCFLPSAGGTMYLIRTVMLPKLKAAMSDVDIIAGSEEQQPQLDRMRQITCRGCNETRCPLNFRYRAPSR